MSVVVSATAMRSNFRKQLIVCFISLIVGDNNIVVAFTLPKPVSSVFLRRVYRTINIESSSSSDATYNRIKYDISSRKFPFIFITESPKDLLSRSGTSTKTGEAMKQQLLAVEMMENIDGANKDNDVEKSRSSGGGGVFVVTTAAAGAAFVAFLAIAAIVTVIALRLMKILISRYLYQSRNSPSNNYY